jgi:hypothetical protein
LFHPNWSDPQVVSDFLVLFHPYQSPITSLMLTHPRLCSWARGRCCHSGSFSVHLAVGSVTSPPRSTAAFLARDFEPKYGGLMVV